MQGQFQQNVFPKGTSPPQDEEEEEVDEKEVEEEEEDNDNTSNIEEEEKGGKKVSRWFQNIFISTSANIHLHTFAILCIASIISILVRLNHTICHQTIQ